jgi:hypothetical protein
MGDDIVLRERESLANRVKRQMVILPDCGIDFRLIVMAKDMDMLSMTEEQIWTNENKDIPCVGVIHSDGRLECNPGLCVMRGLYTNTSDLMSDMVTLLHANGFNEIKIYDYDRLEWVPLAQKYHQV